MKTFTRSEKQIINQIANSNNKTFSSLLSDVITNCKIVCDKTNDRITINYSTVNFTPTREERIEIETISQKLLKKVFQSLQIVEILINEGYISLYYSKPMDDITIIGDVNIQDLGIIQNIEDKGIRDLFLQFCNKTFIVYSDLHQFISYGYRTKKDFRDTWLFRLNWVAIFIALFTAVISILITLNNSHNKKIEEALNQIHKQHILQNEKIDIYIKNLHEENESNIKALSSFNDYNKNSLIELRRIRKVDSKLLEEIYMNK